MTARELIISAQSIFEHVAERTGLYVHRETLIVYCLDAVHGGEVECHPAVYRQ